ncbi:UNVERIFIED_CONTAM: hypothetical protein HDU68_007525 [Siphonaria sp. JEL0065]|nr:hypothetical protein HDU68_007525 [Siphonaria sp. JEL0065]
MTSAQKAWVNTLLANNASSDIDTLVAQRTLASSLFSQRVSDSVSSARAALKLLSVDLGAAKRDVDAISNLNNSATKTKANAAFDALLRIDKVKARMLKAKEALSDAQNWSLLADDLDPLLEQKDFVKAAARLADASRSLALLQGTPEFNDRTTMLHQLQNQLESAVVPLLVIALKERDLHAVLRFKTVFEQIQRGSSFGVVYFKGVRQDLVGKWSLLLGKSEGDLAGLDLVERLKEFLNYFLVVLRAELGWSKELFPTSIASTIIKLIHQTFNSLKPSLRFLLDRLKTSQKNQFSLIVTKCFEACVAWCINVERELALFTTTPASSSSSISNVITPVSQQTVTKKPSSIHLHPSTITTTATAAQPSPQLLLQPQTKVDMLTWSHPILETFSPYHQTYTSLESTHLLSTLPSLFTSPRIISQKSNVQRKLAVTIDALLDPVVHVILRAIQASVGRGVAFTGGYAGVGVVEAVDLFLVGVCERVGGVNSGGVLAGLEEVASGGGDVSFSGLNVVLFNIGTDEETDDDDYGIDGVQHKDGQEWTAFELGVKYLGVIKAMEDGIRGEQGAVVKVLERCYARILESSSTGTTGLYLESTDMSIFNSQSATHLLQSSSLNSPSLHSFYTSLHQHENLFPKTTESLATLTQTTQSLLFKAIFTPISLHLPETISSLPVWTSSNDSSSGQGGDLRFSLSPSGYITRVGESLLTLPQRFDMHMGGGGNSEDEAGGGKELSSVDEALEASVRGLPYLIPSDFIYSVESTGEVENQEPTVLELDDIIHLWITSLARSVMSLFVARILEINKLGQGGVRQLAADVDYIVKVVEAMDVDVVDDLKAVGMVLEGGEEAVREELAKRGDAREVVEKVARILSVVIEKMQLYKIVTLAASVASAAPALYIAPTPPNTPISSVAPVAIPAVTTTCSQSASVAPTVNTPAISSVAVPAIPTCVQSSAAPAANTPTQAIYVVPTPAANTVAPATAATPAVIKPATTRATYVAPTPPAGNIPSNTALAPAKVSVPAVPTCVQNSILPAVETPKPTPAGITPTPYFAQTPPAGITPVKVIVVAAATGTPAAYIAPTPPAKNTPAATSIAPAAATPAAYSAPTPPAGNTPAATSVVAPAVPSCTQAAVAPVVNTPKPTPAGITPAIYIAPTPPAGILPTAQTSCTASTAAPAVNTPKPTPAGNTAAAQTTCTASTAAPAVNTPRPTPAGNTPAAITLAPATATKTKKKCAPKDTPAVVVPSSSVVVAPATIPLCTTQTPPAPNTPSVPVYTAPAPSSQVKPVYGFSSSATSWRRSNGDYYYYLHH